MKTNQALKGRRHVAAPEDHRRQRLGRRVLPDVGRVVQVGHRAAAAQRAEGL